MKDIVERLGEINEDSLIMKIVRDCMDAVEEIERLRKENEAHKKTLQIMKQLIAKTEKEASTKISKN